MDAFSLHKTIVPAMQDCDRARQNPQSTAAPWMWEGLVLWWPCVERGGVVRDLSMQRNNGTLLGSPTREVDGSDGRRFVWNPLCFDCGAEGDKWGAYANDHSSIDVDRHTMMCWCRVDNVSRVVSDWTSPCGKANAYGASQYLFLWKPVTSEFRYYINNGSRLAYYTASFGLGWQHWAATYDRSTVRFYFNGIQRASASYSTAVSDTSYTFKVGYPGHADGYYWDGAVNDVRIYNRVLSATEIWRSYADGGAIIRQNTLQPASFMAAAAAQQHRIKPSASSGSSWLVSP